MPVLLTVGIVLAILVWGFAVTRRLAKMREEIKLAWKKLDADQSNEAVKVVYNKHVTAYNKALDDFPANVIGPMSGFKPARPFVSPEA